MEDREPDLTITEWYYKRLTDVFQLSDKTYDGSSWWFVVVPVLVVGAFYVCWMYIKDSRSIRWYFALPLGLMRATVYGLLTYMFLLPTVRETKIWKPRTPPQLERHSRVIVVIDVSDSMATVSDDPKSAGTVRKTRLQKVVEFLSDDNVAFFKKLAEQNPIYIYRFATRLDNEVYAFKEVKDDEAGTKEIRPFITRRKKDSPNEEEVVLLTRWTQQDWTSFATFTDFKPWVVRGLSDAGRDKVLAGFGVEPGGVEWAEDYLAKDDKKAIDELPISDEDKRLLKGNRFSMRGRINLARTITQGTNVTESIDAAFENEKDNMLQGIIVFSDGRSNIGVDARQGETPKEDRKLNPNLDALHRKAKKGNVPIFSIGIGEERTGKSKVIRITDLQTPDQSPPDDAFKIIVEVDGENMPGETAPVQLELYPPDSDQPFVLDGQVPFDRSEPPHGQFEWTIDPAQLPDKVPEDMKPRVFKGKALVEGIWKARATTAKLNDEGKPEGKDRVVSETSLIKVTRKNLSVLLICSAPNRDFQFLLNQLLREKTDKGGDVAVDIDKENVSVYVQNEAGMFQDGKSITYLDNKYRHLRQFPNKLRVEEVANESEEEKWLNLARYDVIIAFDPDWTLLTEEQTKLLQTWVDLQAGGLLHVAGPVNTKKLTYPDNEAKLQPLLEIFPVIAGDYDLKMSARDRRVPRRLDFPGAAPEMEFLRLDDEKPDQIISGWEQFFTGKEMRDERAEIKHGFFDYYPIKEVKAGATIVARYIEPLASENTFDKKDPPYIVTYKYGQGWTAFLGSSEIWRFNQYKGVYFQRFWVKMSRFLASGSRKKQNRRGRILMSKEFAAGDYIRVTAQLLDANLQGLPASSQPELVLKPVELDSYAGMTALDGKKKDGPGPMPKKDDAADPDRLSREKEDYHKKLVKRFPMSARKSGSDTDPGYFQLQKLLASKEFPTGMWRVEVPIPNSSETLSQKFLIRKSSPPELSDIRPDYVALAAISAEVDELKPRLLNKPGTLDEVRRHSFAAPGVTGQRVMFKFDNKQAIELIPDCITAVSQKINNPQVEPEIRKSKIEPRWFNGPELPSWASVWYDRMMGQSERNHTVALWMLVCIGLLSVEWLTRKLLKLA